MFFWGYIEDVRKDIVTDFQVNRTPIEVNTKVSGGGPQFGLGYGHFLALTGSGVKAETSVSGGEVKVNSTRETIWTFDIGDTSFKLISDTMHLKNGDFVVVESYSRDGVYYLAYCILNATKKYSEPSWFPGGYLNKRNLPQKPRMIISHIVLILWSFIAVSFLLIGGIYGGVSGIFGFGIIMCVPSYFFGRRAYNEIKDANYQYKRKLSDITEQNNWIEYRNAEYKKYENEIFSVLENEGFLPKKEENKQIQS